MADGLVFALPSGDLGEPQAVQVFFFDMNAVSVSSTRKCDVPSTVRRRNRKPVGRIFSMNIRFPARCPRPESSADQHVFPETVQHPMNGLDGHHLSPVNRGWGGCPFPQHDLPAFAASNVTAQV